MSLAINASKKLLFQELKVDPPWFQETKSSPTFVPQEDSSNSRRYLSHCAPGWEDHRPGHRWKNAAAFIGLTFPWIQIPYLYFSSQKRVSLKWNLRWSVRVQTHHLLRLPTIWIKCPQRFNPCLCLLGLVGDFSSFKSIKLLEDDTGENPNALEYDVFLNTTSKAQPMRKIIDKLIFIKIKKPAQWKTDNRKKRWASEWEEIFAKDITVLLSSVSHSSKSLDLRRVHGTPWIIAVGQKCGGLGTSFAVGLWSGGRLLRLSLLACDTWDWLQVYMVPEVSWFVGYLVGARQFENWLVLKTHHVLGVRGEILTHQENEQPGF